MTGTDPTRAGEGRPIATVGLTRPVAVRTIAVSVVVFFVAAYAFGWLRATIRGQSFEPIAVSAASVPTAIEWLGVAIGLAALVAVHELIHGVFMQRYGGTPAFGVGVSTFLLPYAYAGTDGTSYTRNQLLVALLAPLTVITAIGVAAMLVTASTLVVVALAANAAGSVSDLRIAAILIQYPATVRVAEYEDGETGEIAIYDTAGTDTTERVPGTAALSSILTGSVATLVVITLALGTLVFHSLAVSTGDVVVGTDRWLLFRHELDASRTAHVELGGRVVAGLALAGGLCWAVVDRLRNRS